jgi:hypothetical protein
MRLLFAVLASAVLIAWGGYWASRFFEARGVAEARMLELQALTARGQVSPTLEAQVNAGLEQSHEALMWALGAPALLLISGFALLWAMSRR